jgi:hypothetical protein
MHCPQHLGEVIRGIRSSCYGWRGQSRQLFALPPASPKDSKKHERQQARHQRASKPYRAPMHGFWVAPAEPDQEWQDGLLTERCAAPLFTSRRNSAKVPCPALERFHGLLEEHPAGVPLALLFPDACTREVEDGKRVLVPSGRYSQFATDVGIKSASHLGEVLRGSRDGCCHGWRGDMLNAQSLTSSAALGVVESASQVELQLFRAPSSAALAGGLFGGAPALATGGLFGGPASGGYSCDARTIELDLIEYLSTAPTGELAQDVARMDGVSLADMVQVTQVLAEPPILEL